MTELTPRDSGSLDYIQVFDEGCLNTRKNKLIQEFISELQHEDMLKMADKARREFKPIPMFKLPDNKNATEVYGEKAKKLAEEVIEQERQNYVDARTEKDREKLEAIIKRLKFLVFAVNEEGKPEKLKVFVEQVTKTNYRGDWITQDIQYVGDHDTKRLAQISDLKGMLFQLKDFVPYYPETVKRLYEEAINLATLEVIRKEKEN
jgi:hypothetical protein